MPAGTAVLYCTICHHYHYHSTFEFFPFVVQCSKAGYSPQPSIDLDAWAKMASTKVQAKFAGRFFVCMPACARRCCSRAVGRFRSALTLDNALLQLEGRMASGSAPFRMAARLRKCGSERVAVAERLSGSNDLFSLLFCYPETRLRGAEHSLFHPTARCLPGATEKGKLLTT